MYNVGGGSAVVAGGILAMTGPMNTLWAVVVAVALLVLGLMLFALGNRRRRREATMVGL